MSFFSYPVIIHDNCIKESNISWCLPLLSKSSQKGGILLWQIAFDNITNKLLTKHGYHGGSIQDENTDVKINLSNRNIQEQAFLEANRKYINKKRDHYQEYNINNPIINEETHLEEDLFTLNITPINNISIQQNIETTKDYILEFSVPNTVNETTFDAVKQRSNKKEVIVFLQLANKYKSPEVNGQKQTTNIHYFPISGQPKYDGVRATCIYSDNEIHFYSRKGLEYLWLFELKEEMKQFLNFFPQMYNLDGELYNSELTFEQRISAVKTEKTRSPYNQYMYYCLFDIIIPEKTLEERQKFLADVVKKYLDAGNKFTRILLVESFVINSHEEIKIQHDKMVENGYEGLIVRKLSSALPPGKKKESYYTGSRNNNLLKVKAFQDDEGIITNVYDGEGREKGLAIFTVRDKLGNLFDVRPKGTFEQREYWFNNKNICIGKEYTYRYAELTGKGIPRFPVGIAFRDYEGKKIKKDDED